MADVQAVQLRAKLVVLSCCHSGRGTVTAEGVVGIARAFLGAGARSVLVSLWAIDDKATMEFMIRFYENQSCGYSAGLSLDRAMKSLRETEQFGAGLHLYSLVMTSMSTLDERNKSIVSTFRSRLLGI